MTPGGTRGLKTMGQLYRARVCLNASVFHVMTSCLWVILKSRAPLPGIPDFFLELWKLRQIVTAPRTLNAGGEAKG